MGVFDQDLLKETVRTESGQMDDMGRFVFFEKGLCRGRVTEKMARVRVNGGRKTVGNRTGTRLPQVGLFGAGKDPGLAIAAAIARVWELGVEDMANGVADEALAASDENDIRHVAHAALWKFE